MSKNYIIYESRFSTYFNLYRNYAFLRFLFRLLPSRFPGFFHSVRCFIRRHSSAVCPLPVHQKQHAADRPRGYRKGEDRGEKTDQKKLSHVPSQHVKIVDDAHARRNEEKRWRRWKGSEPGCPLCGQRTYVIIATVNHILSKTP